MPGIEARNTAGYESPIGLTADPVVFTLLDGALCVLLARRLEEPVEDAFTKFKNAASTLTYGGYTFPNLYPAFWAAL